MGLRARHDFDSRDGRMLAAAKRARSRIGGSDGIRCRCLERIVLGAGICGAAAVGALADLAAVACELRGVARKFVAAGCFVWALCGLARSAESRVYAENGGVRSTADVGMGVDERLYGGFVVAAHTMDECCA